MAEYIEREAVEARLNARYNYLLKKYGPYDHYTVGYEEAVDTVDYFPSAADVAPIVRCRDCNYSDGDLSRLVCRCMDCEVAADFWCAYGAKMDGGDDGA